MVLTTATILLNGGVVDPQLRILGGRGREPFQSPIPLLPAEVALATIIAKTLPQRITADRAGVIVRIINVSTRCH